MTKKKDNKWKLKEHIHLWMAFSALTKCAFIFLGHNAFYSKPIYKVQAALILQKMIGILGPEAMIVTTITKLQNKTEKKIIQANPTTNQFQIISNQFYFSSARVKGRKKATKSCMAKPKECNKTLLPIAETWNPKGQHNNICSHWWMNQPMTWRHSGRFKNVFAHQKASLTNEYYDSFSQHCTSETCRKLMTKLYSRKQWLLKYQQCTAVQCICNQLQPIPQTPCTSTSFIVFVDPSNLFSDATK